MPHNDYARPSNQWPDEIVPGAGDFRHWDLLQSQSIDGDDGGGTYAPAKPIIICGAGMSVNNLSVVTGNITTQSGGRVKTLNGTDRPTLGGNLANGRIHALVMPILRAGIWVNSAAGSQLEEDFLNMIVGTPGIGLGFRAVPDLLTISFPRRYVHDGATLATVGLQFFLANRPSVTPTTWPVILLDAVDETGAALTFPNGNRGIISAWGTGVSYAVGNYVQPSGAATNNGYYFRVTTAGTSSGAEPAWPSVVGTSVTGGGGVVYKCVGRSGSYPSKGATIDSYYNGGVYGPGQTLYFDTDASVVNTVSGFAGQYRLQMVTGTIDPNMILTGIYLLYDYITLLGLE